MAVLFPNTFGHTLNPINRAELLQGFLNIENAEGVTNGKLTKANMDSYNKKTFIAADPNSAVASYFTKNFDAIAAFENASNDNAISVDDLVRPRRALPTPPPVTNPTGTGTSTGTNNGTNTAFPIFIPVNFPPNNGTQGIFGQSAPNTGLNNQNASQLMLLIISQVIQLFKSIR